jgi:hypothetical protein
MFATTAITLLCTAGISFYVRFLVALCKECKPRRIGHWVRLRLGSGEESIPELRQRERPATRTADKVFRGDAKVAAELGLCFQNREGGFDVDPRSIRRTISRALPPL